MPTIVTADRLINHGKSIEQPVVVIEDAVITRIGTRKDTEIPAGEVFDFPGCTLLPSYFDVHIHGSKNHDVMEATPEAFATIGNFLATHGVGSYLATTVTAPWDDTLRSLERMAKLIGTDIPGARPIGIHLEGPFLSPHRKGAHPENLLVNPTVDRFDQLWQASEGKVRLMTIAPELPNALDVIARAKSLGVRISMGHTNADTEQAKAGSRAGADSATHTFNAMRSFDHRNPGIVGEVLTNDGLFAELICDGLHVDPEAVRIYWRAKGPKRAILVTDAMAAAGMPSGHYKLGQLAVEVKDGRCVLATDASVLAGSVLTLDKALKNFAEFTGAPLEETANLVGPNQALMTGFDDRTAALAVNRAADVTVLNAANEVAATILRGQRIS